MESGHKARSFSSIAGSALRNARPSYLPSSLPNNQRHHPNSSRPFAVLTVFYLASALSHSTDVIVACIFYETSLHPPIQPSVHDGPSSTTGCPCTFRDRQDILFGALSGFSIPCSLLHNDIARMFVQLWLRCKYHVFASAFDKFVFPVSRWKMRTMFARVIRFLVNVARYSDLFRFSEKNLLQR